ncbi:hypothetical protein F511_28289 [Dorcoceras hygrometricum]|uniref:Uncharacterized protein n=1 Tax=Dorcoceras hygrometricum TaxID=472368 RepID=A0A2Z7DCR1_9LAMI|nr:hypothetical protein F511_28289 [Dorcoceras hygrometricum]
MRHPISLLRPPWPEPHLLEHPQVQPVPTDLATVPTMVHDERTKAGTVLHAHDAHMICCSRALYLCSVRTRMLFRRAGNSGTSSPCWDLLATMSGVGSSHIS